MSVIIACPTGVSIHAEKPLSKEGLISLGKVLNSVGH